MDNNNKAMDIYINSLLLQIETQGKLIEEYKIRIQELENQIAKQKLLHNEQANTY